LRRYNLAGGWKLGSADDFFDDGIWNYDLIKKYGKQSKSLRAAR
jgi:hypothetical protein